MFEMLQSRFGEDAMRPKSVYGFANVEDFLSIDDRIVYIPSKYDPAPSQVHYLNCNALGVYFHDCYYHLSVESAIPRDHRQIWFDLAGMFKQRGLLNTREFLLDRNFLNYLLSTDKTNKEKFVDALQTLFVDFPKEESLNASQKNYTTVIDNGSLALLMHYVLRYTKFLQTAYAFNFLEALFNKNPRKFITQLIQLDIDPGLLANAVRECGFTPTSMSLDGLGLNPKGIQVILPLIQALTSVTSLDLSNNDIGAEGMHLLLPVLASFTSLASLDLSNTSLGLEGMQLLAAILPSFTSLQYISLSTNHIGPERAKNISNNPLLSSFA
jgi:hypothetical protein